VPNDQEGFIVESTTLEGLTHSPGGLSVSGSIRFNHPFHKPILSEEISGGDLRFQKSI
jgi:hypothetical protein